MRASPNTVQLGRRDHGLLEGRAPRTPGGHGSRRVAKLRSPPSGIEAEALSSEGVAG
jgi:hypothetical protein